VKRQQLFVEAPDVVQKSHRAFSVFFQKLVMLLLIFQKMNPQHQAEFVGDDFGLLQQRARTGVKRMRFDDNLDQGIIVPLFGKPPRVGEAFLGGFATGRGKVEKDLADQAADARLFGRAGRFLFKDVHVAERRRAGFDHFRACQERSPVSQMRIDVFRLRREHIIVKPLHQLQIVRDSAEAGHRGVCVRVDETGKHQGVFGVDDFFCGIPLQNLFFPADVNDG